MGEHCKNHFFFYILVSLRCTMGNNRKSIPLKERSSVPISKLTKGADQGWAPMKSTKKGRAPMKPTKKGLASGNRGRAPAPIQNLLQGRLMTFADIFSEINLDSSITYVIILTNLIFLASKLGVPTLNIIWSFLHDRDIKDMSKIIRKQKYLNFDRRKTLQK